MDPLALRGRALRKEIVATYRRLRSAGAIKMRVSPDVTSIVEKYIPAGMAFDDAEAILRARAAG